ncbi:HTH-type transcriptional activator IlvY [Thalassotalea aquiviva]|uniref:HTH-type transcriptional activator IlvY n=1 Tax=Thalassotalea aquiviva TaxID=3242415 RepID=UPI00352B7BB7
MEIKSLQAFCHLADSLHFGQSAKALHLSPSTLSRMVQRLEETLGSELFIRDNRRVQLTQAGGTFLKFAEQQIQQWQLLQIQLQTDRVELSGSLRIFCSVTAAYSHLPTLLEGFRLQHPKVEIILVTGNAADAVFEVSKNTADIAIAAKPESMPSSVEFKEIGKIPMAIIAPTMACQVKLDLKQQPIEWATIPVILPDHGPARSRFELWLKKQGVTRPKVYATVTGHEALVSMVALGCGIGIAPQVVIDNSPVKDRVYTLSEPDTISAFDLGLCWQKRKTTQPIVKAFLDSLPK